MAKKLTKGQQKRLVQSIRDKTVKLFTEVNLGHSALPLVVSFKDMEAIEKLCSKWMKRIG